jgi:RNA 2',3'-cyclic 3'-phosphodiesterase
VNGLSAAEPMRLFVAIDLPDEAKEAIAAEQRRIAEALPGSPRSLRLIGPAQMHLTLVFLGEVQDSVVPSAVESMNHPSDVTPFDMTLGGAGVFPARGAPRVLWVGVMQGAASLRRLQAQIADRIRALSIAFEDREFHPHLTLGRWRESRSSDRMRVLNAASRGAIARVPVEGATLYRSHLSPAGSTYTALARVNLSDTNL